MEEFKKFGGYAPCAFYAGYRPGREAIVNTAKEKDENLFTYEYLPGGSYSPAVQKSGKTSKVVISRGKGWKDWVYQDVPANLYLLKLTSKGREEFFKFFVKMYQGFAGNDIDIILENSGTEENKEKYGNLFADFATFNPLTEINNFLDGMVKEGIVIAPSLMYALAEGFSYNRTSKEGLISLQEDFMVRTIEKKKKYIDRLKHLYKWNLTEVLPGYRGIYVGSGISRKHRGPLIFSREKISIQEIGRGNPPKNWGSGMGTPERKQFIKDWWAGVPAKPKK